MRRLAWLCLLPALALSSCGAPAERGAQIPTLPAANGWIALVPVESSSLEEWLAWPSLAAVADAGSAALLSTRNPSDARTQALERELNDAGVAFDDPGATSGRRVTSEDPQSLEQADATVKELLADTRRPTIVAYSTSAPPDRARKRQFLGVIAIVGPSTTRGVLRSATTRRDGLVASSDVAPTVLRLAGVPAPDSMKGRVMTIVESADVSPRLRSFDQELRHASDVRGPLVRGFVFIAMTLVILAAFAVARHSLRARVPLTGLVAVCAAPLAMLVEPLLPAAGTTGASAVWVAALALAIGIAAAQIFGVARGLALVCGATSLAVLVDLALGGPLASRSPISYLLAEGARFYGIGNELMGVVIGGLVVAVAVLLENKPDARVTGPLIFASAVWLMASPTIGAKFGSAMTAVPAFALIAARGGGRRATLRLVLALEAGAVALTTLVYASDRLKPAAERTHIGGAATGAGATIARKIATAIRVAAFSYWMVMLLVFVAAALGVARARRDDVRRLRRTRPMLEATMIAAALAIVSAIAINDAGTIAAALIALPCVVLLLHAFPSERTNVVDLDS